MISVQHLSKEIDGTVILKDIDFVIEKQKLAILLGANGAGKSTLLRCLVGISKYSAGKIVIDHKEWNRKNRKQIKQSISYVPDKVNFDYNLTVMQNLIHHAALHNVSKIRAKAVIQKMFGVFNLKGRENDNIKEFSFGMQKKALIIRGLLSDPKILLLDEPTNGLDPLAKKDLINSLIKLKEMGLTILISTQSLQLVRHADQVIFIKDGAVSHLGNTDTSNEVLSFFTTDLEHELWQKIKIELESNDFVNKVHKSSNIIQVDLKNQPDYIAGCISDLLKSGLVFYSIEFRNTSYENFYL